VRFQEKNRERGKKDPSIGNSSCVGVPHGRRDWGASAERKEDSLCGWNQESAVGRAIVKEKETENERNQRRKKPRFLPTPTQKSERGEPEKVEGLLFAPIWEGGKLLTIDHYTEVHESFGNMKSENMWQG